MKVWHIILFLLAVNLVAFYLVTPLPGYYRLDVPIACVIAIMWILLDTALLLILYRYPLLFLNFVLKLFPKNIEYRTHRAGIYNQHKRYKLALQDLNYAIKLDSKAAETYYYRGTTYTYLRQYQLALHDCNQALVYKPRYPNAYYGSGMAYLMLKQHDQAIKNFNEVLLLSSKKRWRASAYEGRGTAYQQTGEYDLALQDFQQALALHPNDAKIYNNCAMAHIFLKEYEPAIQLCNQAMALNAHSFDAFGTRGLAYLGLNNLQQASADLSHACKLQPQSTFYNWYLEWIRLCQETPDQKTVERFNALVELPSDHLAEAPLFHGIIHWIEGKNEEALAEFERSLQLNSSPTRWGVYFWKGIACASLGRDDEARTAIQTALAQAMPPILLSPLRWLEKERPEFYREFALLLLN